MSCDRNETRHIHLVGCQTEWHSVNSWALFLFHFIPIFYQYEDERRWKEDHGKGALYWSINVTISNCNQIVIKSPCKSCHRLSKSTFFISNCNKFQIDTYDWCQFLFVSGIIKTKRRARDWLLYPGVVCHQKVTVSLKKVKQSFKNRSLKYFEGRWVMLSRIIIILSFLLISLKNYFRLGVTNTDASWKISTSKLHISEEFYSGPYLL